MTEHAHEHPPTKILMTIGIIVGFWIIVTLVFLGAFGIHSGWPAFLALPLFFLVGGSDMKQLANVFVGGAAGLIISAGVAPAIGIGMMKMGLGLTPATLLVVFLLVALIVGLGGAVPLVFNNFNLVYFTVALIFVGKPEFQLVQWLTTLVLGGAIFVGGTLLCMNFILPRLTKADSAIYIEE